MKKVLSLTILFAMLAIATPAFATEGTPGKISGRSVGAAALSLLVCVKTHLVWLLVTDGLIIVSSLLFIPILV